MEEDARLFGVDIGDAARPEPCIVMPEAWDAVRLFCACSTQWRIGPSGRAAGIDYRGAMAAAAGLGVRWKSVFGNLRIMEEEALAAMAADQP